MSTCPACKNNKLIRVGDTYQCNDSECGYIEQIKITKAQKWLLKIAKNDRVYWRRVFFNDLPTFIAHEYRRLWLMARRPNVFCMVYQLKDVCEVLLKFPVLCAAAYLQSEEIDEKLIEKAPAIGDWKSICNFIIGKYSGEYRYDLPQFLRNILEGIHEVFTETNAANYRNDYLGHGAMGFEDNQEYRKFGENLVEKISEHLGKVLSDYAKLSVTVDGVEFKGWRVPKNIDGNAQPILHIEGREIPLFPYIVNTEKHGVLFFDNYAYGKNNQTAQGLNYMMGGGRKRFVAPYYCELYSRRFKNVIKTVDENAPVDGDTMLKKLEEVLNELNAAENFVRPNYIIKWLDGRVKDAKGSVNLLMMERGMGKTSLSYAIASGKVSEFKGVFVAAYYCGQSQIQSDFIKGINDALADDISEKKTGAFVRLERDSEDKRGNMIAALKYFRDQHAKWNGKSKLMLIIDGLDELPLESADLFDFLPDTEDMPDDIYILLTSRNPERENLSAHVVNSLKSLSVSDRMTVSAEVKNEHSEENLAVLRQYAENKIKVLSGGEMKNLNKKEVEKILSLCRGTFLNLKLYAKLAESGIAVKELPALEDEALFVRYLDEIKKYYGDKLFSEAVTVLYAIVTARESLTMKEIAWLSGEKHVTIKLLAFIKDFGALLKTTRDRNRGALVSAASERYREYIEKMFPEKRAELGEIFTDMLTNADLDEYKNEQGNYNLPDGLTYIAACLPTVLDDISEELLDKVHNDDDRKDINNCTKNSREPHVLSRRAKMGEVWSEYCEKVGLYKKQLNFMKVSGDSYWYMCDYNHALEFDNKKVALSEEYFSSGKIDDENYVANAYMGRGATYQSTGKYAEALSDYGKGIEIMERLHDDGKLYDENDLARAYINRGATYQSTGKYAEALSDYGKCIEIMERLHDDGKLYDENDLAGAYMNRGVALKNIGKYAEALSDYGKCIEIMERLHDDGKLYDENDLATAYMNRGNALGDVGQHNEALSDYGKCIEIMERLHADGKLYDENDLASAYMNRGITYDDLGKYAEALADYGKCIEIRERLHKHGKLYDENHLAKAYLNRGVTYRATGKYAEALDDYGKGIEIMERLHKHGKLYDSCYYLGSAMLNKGILLADGFGDKDEALAVFNQAIAMLEAEKALSYYANDMLQRLYYQRGILTGDW